jgi:hypothetical protein
MMKPATKMAAVRRPHPGNYGGNRCIPLDAADKAPEAALRHCVALALTYHLRRCRGASGK